MNIVSQACLELLILCEQDSRVPLVLDEMKAKLDEELQNMLGPSSCDAAENVNDVREAQRLLRHKRKNEVKAHLPWSQQFMPGVVGGVLGNLL